MYLYQPCLLAMSLYAWAFERTEMPKRRLRILCPLAILAISEWEVTFTKVGLYPAGLLLVLFFIGLQLRSVCWAEVLTASLLGGLLSWKAADAWPLLPGSPLLCASLLLAPIILLCRSREDRLAACALGSLFFELFFCLREYMLFSFFVGRLGSRDALSLASSAICLYHVFEQVCHGVHRRIKDAISIGN